MPDFSVHDLVCLRGGRLVFRNLGFTLHPGAALVLTGANGSGKSSLLRLCAGLSRPFAGWLCWNGADISADMAAHAARLRYVGHLDAVKPALTAGEMARMWAGLDGVPDPAERAAAALADAGLDHLADVPGRCLSAGQKRRLNLARLLLRPVPLWLLDEPTTALDRASVDRFAATIARHRAAGGMVILSTHTDLDLADPDGLDLGQFAAEAAGLAELELDHVPAVGTMVRS
jgi:heme exporter protein A